MKRTIDKALVDELGSRVVSELLAENTPGVVMPVVRRRFRQSVESLLETCVRLGDDDWYWVEEIDTAQLPELYLFAEKLSGPADLQLKEWTVPVAGIKEVYR